MTETRPPVPRKPAPQRGLEAALFAARWLMAPFYIGLVLALAGLLVVFVHEAYVELSHVLSMDAEAALLMALSLIDLSLAGNLLLIVIFSGYENFIATLETRADRPSWMGLVDFSSLKLKLVASIVAISVVAMLRTFLKIGDGPVDSAQLTWQVILQLTFVVSGVLMAVMDRVAARDGH